MRVEFQYARLFIELTYIEPLNIKPADIKPADINSAVAKPVYYIARINNLSKYLDAAVV